MRICSYHDCIPGQSGFPGVSPGSGGWANALSWEVEFGGEDL